MNNIIADYALMAVNSYWNKRDSRNRVFPSTDWQALEGDLGHRSYPSGFEAVAYRNTTSGEIVIAYTGTDELWDWWTNLGGSSGIVVTDQMLEAARFYAEVFRANPNTSITFTGHSMGGGLAGLMAVLFNRSAYTFDPAPFRNSANNDTREIIRNYLQSAGLLDTQLAAALDSFHSSEPAARTGESSEPGIRGENMVWRMLVQNEAVSRWAPGEFIGTRTPAILGHASPDQSSIDLHSMSLLAAIAESPGLFGNAVKEMPNLIPLIFDGSLFNKNPSQASPTLLDHLLRNQVGVTGPTSSEITPLDKRAMLDHFAADLGKVIQGGGDFMSDNNLNRGLIAFLGRAYLKQDQGYEKELFRLTGGGLNFDTADITANISGDKGYSDYLKNYLAAKLGTELFGQYEGRITQLLDWYLAGTQLNATAGTQTAFMLGAGETDSLTGGTQADLLVGLGGTDILAGRGGADTLVGGEGADILMGGAGSDTYVVADGDILFEAADDGFGGDGQGVIQWDGQNPAGSYDLKPDSVTEWGDPDWTFEFVGERDKGGTLTIVKGGERIGVAGFKSGYRTKLGAGGTANQAYWRAAA